MADMLTDRIATDKGIPVPDQPRFKTYEDGLKDGERRGQQEGFSSGLGVGRNECAAQKRAEEAEKARQEAYESRRLFWDTAYMQSQKVQEEEARFDAKTQASKADSDLQGFIADLRGMTANEVLATDRELNKVYADKQAEWKKNHKWWQVLDPMPENPMKLNKSANGLVTSIEFPAQSFSIPITYWNSQTEAAKIGALSDAVRRASGPIDRAIAEKSLAEELSNLKIPQIVQLEARRGASK